MTYIDGFVIAVPTANREKFTDHAHIGDAVFMDHGARRIVECWQDNVPHGKVTDFFRAVAANEDESIVFSWIEWPDKATRDAMYAKMDEITKTDLRFSMEHNPPPFDGKRMIFGGFELLLDAGEKLERAYVQGFILPVLPGQRNAYAAMAAEAAPFFMEHGARRIVETIEDDVSDGTLTDFRRAVNLQDGESVVFSWIEWESADACKAAEQAMQSDERMKMPDVMPFDGKRMIYAGFEPVVILEK